QGVLNVSGPADLTLTNQNLAALDIDGDGIINWVHTPSVQRYGIYTPKFFNNQWNWVGRTIAAAGQQDYRVDFGQDAANIHVLDVNGDGLVDLVRSNGTNLMTFFSLGRYPNGDGQWGHAEWTGPTSSNIHTSAVLSCLPGAPGYPVSFGNHEFHL